MPKLPATTQYDWILSLLAQRIAADQIIQEGAITKLGSEKLFLLGLKRTKLHTRLLQLVLQIGREQDVAGGGSADLVKILFQIKAASDDIATVTIQRIKPMLNVLASEIELAACLRIVIILLLLEDPKLKRVVVELRCRNGYVSVKIAGGMASNLFLLDRELIEMINTVLKPFDANLNWSKRNNKRLVYLRLNLSSQLNLI